MTPRRDSPPAQGGIQILGRAEAVAVVDVPVITQLQFQQSFVEYVEVPQTQFSDRVVDSVASQRHQAAGEGSAAHRGADCRQSAHRSVA